MPKYARINICWPMVLNPKEKIPPCSLPMIRHHQKGQDHTGKGIEKASRNVPEHIVTFFVVTGTQKQRHQRSAIIPSLRFRKFWISRMEIRILAM